MPIRKHIFPTLLFMIIVISSCSVNRRVVSRYQTLSQRAHVTLTWDQHNYSMNSTIRVWHNQLIVASIQPMLGIEMLRIEATPDSIWVFDKMNQQYATFDYTLLTQLTTKKISYTTLQDILSRPLASPESPTHLELTSSRHQLHLSWSFYQREYNTLPPPNRTKINRYKQVILHDILPL